MTPKRKAELREIGEIYRGEGQDVMADALAEALDATEEASDEARQRFVTGYLSLRRDERPNMHEERFQEERVWLASLVAIGLVKQ